MESDQVIPNPIILGTIRLASPEIAAAAGATADYLVIVIGNTRYKLQLLADA